MLIQELRSNQGTLVCHRKNCLLFAVIRELFSPTPMQILEAAYTDPASKYCRYLGCIRSTKPVVRSWQVSRRVSARSRVQEANLRRVGSSNHSYTGSPCNSLLSHMLKAMQVIKAMAYVLDTLPAYDIHIDSVRLSLQGDVKLICHRSNVDPSCPQPPTCITRDRQRTSWTASITRAAKSSGRQKLVSRCSCLLGNPTSRFSSALRERKSTSPAMSSRPDTPQHVFLGKAVSPSRLVPRIRSAIQIRDGEPLVRSVSAPCSDLSPDENEIFDEDGSPTW
jgi:hypothetical protein